MSDQAATDSGATSDTPAPSSVEIRKGSSPHEAARAMRENRKQRQGGGGNDAPTHPSRVAAPEAPAQTDEQPRAPEPDIRSDDGGHQTAEAQTEGDDASASEAHDFPGSVSAFAEALGVDPTDFAEGVTVRAKVNGQEQDISIAEAIAGYQRHGDYRSKSNELAEQRKAFEAERDRITQEANQRMQLADGWLAVLAERLQAGPTDAQMLELARTDPDAYTAAQAQKQALVNDFTRLAQQREALQTDHKQKMEQSRAEEGQRQVEKLFSMSKNKAHGLPDFSDPEQQQKWQSGAAKYLADIGEPQEAIKAFLSPNGWTANQVLILNDAMRYRAAMAQNNGLGEALKAKPKPFLPKAGGQRKASAQDKVDQARAKLAKTGKKQDAMALLRANRQRAKEARRQGAR